MKTPSPPPSVPVPRVVAVLVVLVGAMAGSAAAADVRPVELPLASGKSIEGVVESATRTEVVVRVGEDEVRRVPWAQFAPLAVYRVKSALAPAADGEARKALAELAIELGLYAEARTEYEKALALGAIDARTFQAVVSGAETEAVQVGLARAARQAEAGDFESALETARQLKLHFATAPNARAVDRLIEDLLDDVRKLEAEATKAAKELERVKVEAERNKEILKRRTRAVAEIEKGKAAADEAEAARDKGNVTWARKHAETADEAFTRARRDLGRLRRILDRESDAYRDVLVVLSELDRVHFDLLFQTAWFFWEETVYSRAEEYAARASYIDPVHPELLELRDLLRTSRIRYRFSDITNARPIVR